MYLGGDSPALRPRAWRRHASGAPCCPLCPPHLPHAPLPHPALNVPGDGDGLLQFDEWRTAVREGAKLPPHALSESELAAAFESVDRDANHCISIEELLGFIWP